MKSTSLTSSSASTRRASLPVRSRTASRLIETFFGGGSEDGYEWLLTPMLVCREELLAPGVEADFLGRSSNRPRLNGID